MHPAFWLQSAPIVLVDALVFPALGVATGWPLVAARNYRNLTLVLTHA